MVAETICLIVGGLEALGVGGTGLARWVVNEFWLECINGAFRAITVLTRPPQKAVVTPLTDTVGVRCSTTMVGVVR